MISYNQRRPGGRGDVRDASHSHRDIFDVTFDIYNFPIILNLLDNNDPYTS